MNDRQQREFLKLVWRYGLFEGRSGELTTTQEVRFELLRAGDPTQDGAAEFTDAEIEITNNPTQRIALHGSIKIDTQSSHWREQRTMSLQRFDNVILHVVATPDTVLIRGNRQIPTFVIHPLGPTLQLFNDLTDGRINCPHLFANLEPIYRQEILSRAMADRLRRKSDEIIELYESCNSDWEQTAYVAMLRSLGMGRSKDWYAALGRSLPINHIKKYGGDTTRIEALLLGQAGLLDFGRSDPHTTALQDIYIHQQRELKLQPLSSNPTIGQLRPSSQPTSQLLRAGQILSRLSINGSVAAAVIDAACDSIDTLRALLTPPAVKNHERSIMNISQQKIDLQIINFAIPFIVAYGRTHSNGELHDRAVELYEAINAEENTYTRHWAAQGAELTNAFDSQAIIQLSTEFCAPKRCAECPLGTMQLVRSSRR